MLIGPPKIMIILLFLICIGCTRHYTPDPNAVPLNGVPDFTSSSSISIINNQSPSNEIIFSVRKYTNWTADLHKWTEAALVMTKKELEKHGMAISEGAEKSHKLSITQANHLPGRWKQQCSTALSIDLGNGYSNSYSQTEHTGQFALINPIFRCVDAALMWVVSTMFKDPRVIEYLKE